MTMKKKSPRVFIVFLVLSIKCVFGCSLNSGKLDCSSSTDNWKDVRDIRVNRPTQVEVFDLSKNPLSEGLKKDSFTHFRNVRVLILRRDNLNSDNIEANAFSPLTKLTTLDLSENALKQVPCDLPSSLIDLNLNENPIIDETGCGSDCLSLPSSVEKLSLRDTKGRKKFPRFCASVPSIVELDVSKNSFDSVSVEELAPLCRLQKINLTSVTISHPSGSCQKLQLEKWLKDNGIEIIGNLEAIKHDEDASCDPTPPSKATEIYQNCKIKGYAQKYTWLLIGAGILLLACIVIAFLWWRKRKGSAKTEDLENSASVMVNIKNPESDESDAT